MRENQDLDDVFLPDGDEDRPKRVKRKRRKGIVGQRDRYRRIAFKVLALLSDLDPKQRSAVLRTAERLSKG